MADSVCQCQREGADRQPLSIYVSVSVSAMRDLQVQKINSTVGKAFVREHHYSHGSHNGPMCWGLLDQDRLVGVLAFATPCSENVRRSVLGPEHRNRVTELHRLVILDDYGKNTESWFISRPLAGLKSSRPDIWAVLSFADATEGHVGTIYQATNALYTGTSGRARFYLDPDGRLRHPRQNGHNVTPAEAGAMGWQPTMRDGKHRYLFLLPDNRGHRRWLTRQLLLAPMPYPKGADR